MMNYFLSLGILVSVCASSSLNQQLASAGCDRECVAYTLNYFPTNNILAKCGCNDMSQVNAKFFSKQDHLNSLKGDLIDPIVELYLQKINDIDATILASTDDSEAESEATNTTQTVAQTNTTVYSNTTSFNSTHSNTTESTVSHDYDSFCSSVGDEEETDTCITHFTQCTATCTQKCKTEPSGKQASCI